MPGNLLAAFVKKPEKGLLKRYTPLCWHSFLGLPKGRAASYRKYTALGILVTHLPLSNSSIHSGRKKCSANERPMLDCRLFSFLL
jgi:hypothetical protein